MCCTLVAANVTGPPNAMPRVGPTLSAADGEHAGVPSRLYFVPHAKVGLNWGRLPNRIAQLFRSPPCTVCVSLNRHPGCLPCCWRSWHPTLQRPGASMCQL